MATDVAGVHSGGLLALWRSLRTSWCCPSIPKRLRLNTAPGQRGFLLGFGTAATASSHNSPARLRSSPSSTSLPELSVFRWKLIERDTVSVFPVVNLAHPSDRVAFPSPARSRAQGQLVCDQLGDITCWL